MEDFDPIEDIATPADKQLEDSLESRPSFGMPPSKGTLDASSPMGQREKTKERDPMALIM